jgi:hypothetical protein
MTDPLQHVDLPDDVSAYLLGLTDQLMTGEVELWQVPPAVAGLWMAAWSSHHSGLVERNRYLEQELERMYAVLYSRQNGPVLRPEEHNPERPAPQPMTQHSRLAAALRNLP